MEILLEFRINGSMVRNRWLQVTHEWGLYLFWFVTWSFLKPFVSGRVPSTKGHLLAFSERHVFFLVLVRGTKEPMVWVFYLNVQPISEAAVSLVFGKPKTQCWKVMNSKSMADGRYVTLCEGDGCKDAVYLRRWDLFFVSSADCVQSRWQIYAERW